jgi:hypothetical protein
MGQNETSSFLFIALYATTSASEVHETVLLKPVNGIELLTSSSTESSLLLFINIGIIPYQAIE